MINHRDHFHDNTSRARSTCRLVQDALHLAADLGLDISYADGYWDDEDKVKQFTLAEPGRPWYTTRLTVTYTATGGLQITRFAATCIEEIPSTHLLSWVSTLGVVAKA